ncbi:MAG: MarR family transcriptional regulator [Pseudomonadota bacterium]
MHEDDGHNRRRAAGAALLFEQAARRLLEKRYPHDLHAAQWSALRYFSRAGRRTANVIGLSRYLGNTSGSTSRTARSLVDRGLLAVSPSDHDGRSVMFSLTEEGQKVLIDDPLNELADIFAMLPSENMAQLSQALDFVMADITRRRTP